MRNTVSAVAIALMSCSLFAQAQAPVAQSDVATEITRLEHQMWDLWKGQKYEEMKTHMTTDAILISTDGVMNRDAVIAAIKKNACQVKSYELTDAKVSTPSPGVALIVYRSTADGVCGGKPIPPTGDVSSSLWVRQGNQWLTALHHQSPAGR